MLPEIRNRKNGICPFKDLLQGVLVVQSGLTPQNKIISFRSFLSSSTPGERGLTVATSTPLFSNACAAGLLVSRVIPRILNVAAVLGSLRRDSTTEPPWIPAAPKTTTSFLSELVMTIGWYGVVWELGVEYGRLLEIRTEMFQDRGVGETSM